MFHRFAIGTFTAALLLGRIATLPAGHGFRHLISTGPGVVWQSGTDSGGDGGDGGGGGGTDSGGGGTDGGGDGGGGGGGDGGGGGGGGDAGGDAT